MTILAIYFSDAIILVLLMAFRNMLKELGASEKFSLRFTPSHGENLFKGELYKDTRFQALLSKFYNGRLKAIFPVFNLERGIFYPDVEDFLGGCLEAGEF